MRVRHLSFSSSGGAGRVATELARLQSQAGIDSKLISKISSSLTQSPFKEPVVTALAGLDAIVSNNNRPTLFTHYRDLVSTSDLGEVAEADILHLHWTPGFVNSKDILRIANLKPKLGIIWTLHDMFAFTGGCHHSFDCTGYKENCSNCPQVRTPFKEKPIIALTAKSMDISSNRSISFVSPSNWMADSARSSTILRGSQVSVIPNPVNQNFSESTISQTESREIHGYRDDSIIAILIAEDLSDPNKAIQHFVDLVDEFNSKSDQQIEIILVGRNPKKIHASETEVHRVGSISPPKLAKLVPSADFLAVPSRMENAPSIVLEAASVGVPSLVNSDNEGAVELAIGKNLGELLNSGPLALSVIQDLIKSRRLNPEHLRSTALNYASGSVSGRLYMELYDRVLENLNQ
jgi:glycosyltransferase involved in cell wall biosynthesis